jgi:hypothetical protein
MSETLLTATGAKAGDTAPLPVAAPLAGAASPAATLAATRPPQLPDKFWDERTGQVRLDQLIKSYLDLERRLGAGEAAVPPRVVPDSYDIRVRDDLFLVDPDVNRRLRDAGFSSDQAQLVYDLACDHLLPMINELAALFEAENQIERLQQHFGGKERWREIARQIDAWGRAHLPRRVFEALATTYEGIVTLHRMMSEGDEPGLLRDVSGVSAVPTEAELKSMMRDPRYWRDQDPAYVARIREGFRRLYGDQG